MLLLSATALTKDNETWMHLLLLFALHSSDCTVQGLKTILTCFEIMFSFHFSNVSSNPPVWAWKYLESLGFCCGHSVIFVFMGGKSAFLQNATHSASKLDGTPRHHTESLLEIAKGNQRGQRDITSMTKKWQAKGRGGDGLPWQRALCRQGWMSERIIKVTREFIWESWQIPFFSIS